MPRGSRWTAGRKSRKLSWLAVVMAVLAGVGLILARNVELGPGTPVPLDVAEAREAYPVLSPAQAADHVGSRAVVCGRVASATWAEGIRGQPTFLNFGRPHPRQDFTVIIWGRNREKFGRPEIYYRDREVCVAGAIHEHEGVPRIEATDPIQIRAGATDSVRSGGARRHSSTT